MPDVGNRKKYPTADTSARPMSCATAVRVRVGPVSARLGEQAPTLWEAYDGWLRRAASVIGDSADALNAINVFPVPDADTGSNLKLTLTGISQAVSNLEQASWTRPFRRRSCPRTATREPSSPRCS